MKVAIIYNKDLTGVINTFGMQNKEIYNPKTIKLVANALEQGGHNVEIIDGNMHVIENLQNFMPKVLEGEKLGMVFNMSYGIQGESRYTHIPSLLEMLGIPYVGSNPSGQTLALDKVITKVIMLRHGIPTPAFWVFSSIDEDMSGVQYPVIVKPKMESVSFGLKIVNNENDLRLAVKFIIDEFKQEALVEKFIKGREFAVGVLGNNPVEIFPVLEVDLNNDPMAIQTVEDKRSRPRAKICPANIPPELAAEMQRLSVKAFNSLQLRDFARIDIRLDENNNIFLLEINSMASLGRTGSYVYAAQQYGYDYISLVNKMLDVAVVRYFANSNLLSERNDFTQKTPLHVRLRGFLRSKQQQTEKLLQQVVDNNSHVRNIEGVNQLVAMLKRQFSQLGFNSEVIPQAEIGNIVFFSNCDDDNYDIFFLGNLDNSTRVNRQEYFQTTDQKYFGSGVWEHKGGIVVLIQALQALRFVRLLKRVKIGVLFTSDDVLQGKVSKPIIKAKTLNAKTVIGLHGGSLAGGIVKTRSGAALYNCTMNLRETGDASNVSLAINLFSKLIASWTDLTNTEEGVVVSPSDVVMHSNITEPYAHGELTLSLRFNKLEQIAFIDAKIRRLVPSKFKDKINFQIEGGERRPPMEATEKSEELWLKIVEIAQKLDIRVTQEHRWSSSDLGYIENDKERIDGMGPVGTKPSNKSEYILKHSLLERAVLLAMLINSMVEGE